MPKNFLKHKIRKLASITLFFLIPLLIGLGYILILHMETKSFLEEGYACIHVHGQYVCKDSKCHCFK